MTDDDAERVPESPHDPERVEGLVRRATVMRDSLRILSEYQHYTFEEYRTNRELRDVVERRLEKLSQAAIDIGQRSLG